MSNIVSKLTFKNVSYDLADESARSAVNNLENQLNATRDDLQNMIAAVGSPLVAATTSAMTDTNKIYVYTGTTTTVSSVTFTAGNWYYHDGTKWQLGGTYNETALETDTTLKVSGHAADAKVVGDALGDIIADEYSTTSLYSVGDYCLHNEKLYRCSTEISVAEEWTSGHWTLVNVTGEVANLKDALDYNVMNIVNGTVCFQTAGFINGYIYSSGSPSGYTENDYRAYTTVMQVFKEQITVRVDVSGYRAEIYYYSGEVINSAYKQGVYGIGSGRLSMELTIPANQHFAFYVYKVGDTNPLSVSTAEKVLIIKSAFARESSVNLVQNEVDVAQKAVENIKRDIVSGQMYFEGEFINGYITSAGSPSGYTENDYRAYTTVMQKFPYDIKLKINGQYRAQVFFYSSAEMASANKQALYLIGYGTLNSVLVIPANQHFAFYVYKQNDTTTPISISVAEKIAYYQSYFDRNSLDNVNVRYNDRKDILTQFTRLPMFLIYTDIHGYKPYYDRIEEFYNENCKESCLDVICLGDIVHDKFSDSSEFLDSTDFGKKTLLTIGNHDCYNGTTVGGVSREDVYQKFFGNVGFWGVTQPSNASTAYDMYYYKDYANKIRLIVLDEYYWDANQLNWFSSTLESARVAGLSVLVAQHQVNYVENEFSELSDGAFFTDEYSFIRTTSGYQDRRNAVNTFKGNGGEFVGWLNGHTHCEYFGTFELSNGKQLSMTFSNASADTTSRVKIDGYSQDCFYYVAVDTTLKYVYVLTVGQATNKWGKKNLLLVYDYSNHIVKRYY